MTIIGKRVQAVYVDTDKESMALAFDDGTYALWWHEHECSENVRIEEVAGEWSDLLGRLQRYEEKASEHRGGREGHYTWTFYDLITDRGTVSLRWLGESNGFYSEEVSFWHGDPETYVVRGSYLERCDQENALEALKKLLAQEPVAGKPPVS